MNSLQRFISDFLQNKGHHVFLSLLIAKICGFLGSLIIIKILPENEFGVVSIVASIFAIFMPFSGFGSHQSLLRFGALTSDLSEKQGLSDYLLKQGLIYQILLSAIFLLCSCFYVTKYVDVFYIFIFFTVRLIGFYFLNYMQSYQRIFGNNKGFAQLNNVVNIAGLILLLALSYFFGLWGYLLAIALTPFLALFWFKKEYFHSGFRIHFEKKIIWNYALYASFTGLLSDALFSVDILILSFLMNEGAVANYRVAILIPANITFLAATFMQSDYPVLAKNYVNKSFLKNYLQNFYKIFVPLSLGIFVVFYVLRENVLTLFFSIRYSDNAGVFAVFLACFCLNMLLRNLYGTLLSAVGMMRFVTFVSILNLVLLVAFSFVFVNRWGIMGMAFSMTMSMIISGLLLMLSFFYYLKKLK